jgi:hypothetical protein
MRTIQIRWLEKEGWTPATPDALAGFDLIFAFGSRATLQNSTVFQSLRQCAENALVVGCSTAGEICGTQVSDDSLCLTGVQFDFTKVAGARTTIQGDHGSYEAGFRLAGELAHDGLTHVLVFSDGLHVNGSELVSGLRDGLPAHVTITGGLSGDGDRFQETLVVLGDSLSSKGIVAVGLYGSRLRIGYGSMGGWDPFGPERLITRAEGNVLFELDGRSALNLYKEYLGDHAKGLPASGLLFPLSIRSRTDETPVVRTILSVDEAKRSLTFAGDIPQGAYARLMKANFDRLIDGAATAARRSIHPMAGSGASLALLISCVGRKLLLRQRIEEEVESVREVFHADCALTGFYSYGEISPFTPNAKCELHNQTMTITTFSEA